MNNAKHLLNKQIIIGKTTLNEAGNVKVQIHTQGQITQLFNNGIAIQALNGLDGVTQIPVRGSDLFQNAPRGEYELQPTGQKVKNPDVLLVQPGKLPATNNGSAPNGVWKAQEKSLAFPAVCVSCGAEDRPLHAWTMKARVENLSGISAATIFAGVVVKNIKKYTFEVPICETCKSRRESIITLRKWGMIVSAIAAVSGFILWNVAAYRHIGSIDLGMWLFLIGLLTLLVLYLFFKEVGTSSGTFSGKEFKFNNRIFHNRFSVLYPSLVKLPKSAFQK